MKPIHWRRSWFGKYLRLMPRVKHIRGTWLHRRLGDRLFHSELWHPTRRRFAGGMAVGAFFAMIPSPGQTVGAALLAYFTRVNIPAAVAATWISNPLTMPLCVYVQYRIGCLILGHWRSEIPTHDIFEMLKQAPIPFLVGVLPSGALLSLIVYPLTLLLWDIFTARFHARRAVIKNGGSGSDVPPHDEK